jgi:hypothetical protein
MRSTRVLRRALTPLLLCVSTLAVAGCGGSDGSGPNDDDVFGTYTLVRANGEQVPGALVLALVPAPGTGVNTYAESGSFRISENGTWAFSMHFEQIAIDDDDQVSNLEYDVDDSGTYSMQGETITLDGVVTVTLAGGVLSRSIHYDVPGGAPTTVVYEFEK